MNFKLVLLAGAAIAPQILPAENARKNVLFIIVDDMKPTIGCFGDKLAVTPHLDSLGDVSTVYSNAFCQQALSGPTRASLFTGLAPDRNGVTELNTSMRAMHPGIVTMPQYFRENGYTTCSFGKIFHGDENSLDPKSWSETPVNYSYTKNDEYRLPANRTGKKAAAFEFTDSPDSEYFDVSTRTKAIARMKGLAAEGKPFFLAVGFLKPHLPFCAPERFLDAYKDQDFEIDTARIEGAPKIAYHNSQELRGYTDIPDVGDIDLESQKMLKKAYYACSSFADENIGILIQALKDEGLYESTVIVFVGDHGYHTGEQGLWCKSTNYYAACHAPLMIHDCGQTEGRNVGGFTEFLDIFPTLCSLCGLSVPENLQGQDVSGRDFKGKDCAFSQFVRPYETITKPSRKTHSGYAVRTKKWTYVQWQDLSGKITDRELYNTRRDPTEKKNIAGTKRARRICLYLSKKIEDRNKQQNTMEIKD